MFKHINTEWAESGSWSCRGHHAGEGLFNWLRRTTKTGIGGVDGLRLHVLIEHVGRRRRTGRVRQIQRGGAGSVQVQVAHVGGSVRIQGADIEEHECRG